jgi:hypothetical protein
LFHATAVQVLARTVQPVIQILQHLQSSSFIMKTRQNMKKSIIVGALLPLLGPLMIGVHGQIDEACRGASEKDILDNVRVLGGGQSATLAWDYPEGVCFLDFRITATELNEYGKEVDDAGEFFTKLKSTEIPELKQGVPYRFTVEVHYGGDNYGASGSTVATPYIFCVEEGVPGAVENVVVKSQEGEEVTLCWAPPNGGGCVDEYTVGRRMKPRNDAEAFADAYQWKIEKFELPGCHTFKGHVDDRTYEYGIRGYNAASKSPGEPFVKEVHVASSWSCVPVAPYYEYCQAAKSKQCKPLDCEGIAANDLCGLPSVRKYDVEKKTVVQYCSMFCGCNTPDEEELETIETLDILNPNAVTQDDFACCDFEE